MGGERERGKGMGTWRERAGEWEKQRCLLCLALQLHSIVAIRHCSVVSGDVVILWQVSYIQFVEHQLCKPVSKKNVI